VNGRYSQGVIDVVAFWAARLVPGWRVNLVDERPGDDCHYAAVSWGDSNFALDIWLSDEAMMEPWTELTATIIHELLHPLFRELRQGFMPEPGDPAREAWVHQEELIVERISTAVGYMDSKPEAFVGPFTPA